MMGCSSDSSLCVQVAELGGLGRVSFAPGTVATLVAGIPSVYFLRLLGEPLAFMLAVILLVSSCYCAQVAESALGKTDPGEVVIDELVGFVVTMYGVPLTFQSLVLGIVSFRLMDIWKPWPVGLFEEKLKGGVAIVMDDVAAGIIAHVLVWAGLKVWGQW